MKRDAVSVREAHDQPDARTPLARATVHSFRLADALGATLRNHTDLFQFTWFACFAGLIAVAIADHPAAFWSEPAIDVTAATAWLAGGNPWGVD
jgi:hypothetical protein